MTLSRTSRKSEFFSVKRTQKSKKIKCAFLHSFVDNKIDHHTICVRLRLQFAPHVFFLIFSANLQSWSTNHYIQADDSGKNRIRAKFFVWDKPGDIVTRIHMFHCVRYVIASPFHVCTIVSQSAPVRSQQILQMKRNLIFFFYTNGLILAGTKTWLVHILNFITVICYLERY